MARVQTLVQLSDHLVRRLDERALRDGRSRSALIREAIESYLRDEIQSGIDRQIVDAYTRVPQTDEELELADWAAEETLRSLDGEEEPW